MDNETELREIEGVENENKGVDSENEGVDNEVLPLEKNDIAYELFSSLTIIMEEPISAPWVGTTWLLSPMPSTMS